MVKDIEMGMEVVVSEETTVKSPKSCEAADGKCGSSVCTFNACAPVLGGTVLLLTGLAICSQSGHFGRRLCFKFMRPTRMTCANKGTYGKGHCGARCGLQDDGCEGYDKQNYEGRILPTFGFFGCRTNFNHVLEDCTNIPEGILHHTCCRTADPCTCLGLRPNQKKGRRAPVRFCGTTCCAKKNGGCCSIFDNREHEGYLGYVCTRDAGENGHICDKPCREQGKPWLKEILTRFRYWNMIEGSYWFLSARWSPFQCFHDAMQFCSGGEREWCLDDTYPKSAGKTETKKEVPLSKEVSPSTSTKVPSTEVPLSTRTTAAVPLSTRTTAAVPLSGKVVKRLLENNRTITSSKGVAKILDPKHTN